VRHVAIPVVVVVAVPFSSVKIFAEPAATLR
jgi:hypothetical protein